MSLKAEILELEMKISVNMDNVASVSKAMGKLGKYSDKIKIIKKCINGTKYERAWMLLIYRV